MKKSGKNVSGDDKSVSSTRSLIVAKKGQHAFDKAQRVHLRSNFRAELRVVAASCKSWIIDVCTSYDYYPFRLQTRIGDELRYRILGAASGSGSEVAIFDVELGNTLRIVDAKGATISSMCISRPLLVDRVPPVIVLGASNGKVYVYDMMTGDSLLHPQLAAYRHPNPISSIAVNEGGLLYMFLACGNAIYVWDFDKGVLKDVWDSFHTAPVKKVYLHYEVSMFGAETRYVITAGDDMNINVFDAKELKHLHSLHGYHEACITAICTLAANKMSYLASGGRDGSIRIFDLHTYEHKMSLSHPPGLGLGFGGEGLGFDSVLALEAISQQFHPGLLSAGRSGKIYVWDLSSYSLMTTIDAHSSTIMSLKFVKDPHWFMISGGHDNCVKLWDLELLCKSGSSSSSAASSSSSSSSGAFAFVTILQRREEEEMKAAADEQMATDLLESP